MKLILIVSIFFIIISNNFAQVLHPLGLKNKDMKSNSFFKESNIKALNPLSSVDHSNNIPPVGDQGQLGSCVGWAAGYYYKTYQEFEDYGWSVTDKHHIFSPSFVYNHINGGADYGADFDDAFKLLVDNGCANIYDFPYTGDINLWPSENVYLDAIKYRSQEAYFINASTTAGIQQLKQYISNGHCAVLGISIYPNFDDIQNFEYVYCSSDVSGKIRGDHAVTIVGYDDNKQTHDGMGAFKLVNSWGTGWGMSGYFWMSYTAVMDKILSGQTAYYSTSKNHYLPGLIARINLTSSSREKIRIKFGIGNSGSPLWYKEFFNFNTNVYTNVEFPATKLVFDLSDGMNVLDSNSASIIFLSCRNASPGGYPGMINYFSSTNMNWDLTFVSDETPKIVPGSTVDAIVNVFLGPNISTNVGVYSIDIPDNISIGNTIPKITVRNYGTAIQSFPVTMEILNTSNNNTVYMENSSATNISPSNNVQINFPSFSSGIGRYKIVAYTQLSTDSLKANDTTTKIINIYDIAQTPLLSSPIDGNTGLYKNVNLVWRKSEGATNYYLQVSRDQLFTDLVLRDSSLTDTTKMIYGLSLLTTYYWRVKAINPANSSSFSNVYSFKTKGYPQSVILLSPLNSEVNVSIPVTFKWSKSYDLTENKSVKNKSIDAIDKYLLEFTNDTSNSIGYNVKAASDTLVVVDSLQTYSNYYWRVSARNELGWGTKSNWWKFSTGNVGIKQISSQVPAEFKLFNNYPNPFNPSTNIKFSLPDNSNVNLIIYDIEGRQVAELLKVKLNSGIYVINFNMANYASGIYFFRLIADSPNRKDKFIEFKKMILIK
jgi:hypothetical protein